MRNLVLMLTATAALLCVTCAQAHAQESGAAELQRFAWLVGEWEGDGWIVDPGGQRHDFVQRERITWLAGGRAILIEGTGFAVAEPTIAVHEAVALLSHDAATGSYAFRAYQAAGRGMQATDAAVEPTVDGFVWSFTPPGGPMLRFTIRETPEGEWHEIGEVAAGAENWYRVLEMKLRRVR